MTTGSRPKLAPSVPLHLFLGPALAVLAACSGGSSTTTGGGGASSSTTSTTTSSASSGTGGVGGASSGTGTGGAGGTGAGVGGSIGGFACSGASPAFSTVVFPMILSGCSGAEGCHQLSIGNPNVSYGYLVDQATMECTDGRKRVAPGDPEHSYLIDKLTNQDVCSGMPMPLAGLIHPGGGGGMWHPLPTADIQTLYDWICAGAKND